MDNEYSLINDLSNIPQEDKLEFQSGIRATTNAKSNYHKIECDLSWLDIMEDTVRYIDNILMNPKKFIINEEEIVKVEKSKKVTVESVIHLSQHTSLISDYNAETGDVKPTKVLNILKEETLDTYENRFIYSLIINMQNFIARYGPAAMEGSRLSNSRSIQYNGSTRKGEERIDISLNMNSVIESNLDKKVDGLTPKQRLENLKNHVTDFTGSQLYKDLARLHVSMVRSPIRKTNVILKNPNFQRAEALWNFMERYDKDVRSEIKYNRNLSDNQELKTDLDMSFLINYAIIEKLSKDHKTESDWQEVVMTMIQHSIKSFMDYNPNVDENKFANIVRKEFKAIKRDQKVRLGEIKHILNKDMQDFKNRKNKALNCIAVKTS